MTLAVQDLPLQPGVYRFYDDRDILLYIGKATQLRSRVQSYFRSSTLLSPAKQIMVRKINKIEYTVVDTPDEALLLETTLIKKYKPPYNVVMKDDKNFQYIHITAELFPRIETVRRITRSKLAGKYFGPYTSGLALKRILHVLKKVFKYCEHPPKVVRGKVVYPKRPCLNFHLGKCIGPCAGAITIEEYRKIFTTIEEFLKGDYEVVTNQLQHDMVQAAAQQNFETAAQLRDQFQAIEYLVAEQKVISTRDDSADYLSLAQDAKRAAVNIFQVRRGKLFHQEVVVLQHIAQQTEADIMQAFCDQYYGNIVTHPTNLYMSTEVRKGRHKRLLAMGIKNAQDALQRESKKPVPTTHSQQGLQELAQVLQLDRAKLNRIEIYDISHFQGKYTVGAMVVFMNGEASKKDYRKFKIKSHTKNDDFASMREVMLRRVNHLPKFSSDRSRPVTTGITKTWPQPDLIIIDGGKGQLSSAKAILDQSKLTIPIVSLAKKEETLIVPGSDAAVGVEYYSTPTAAVFNEIQLPKGSEGYHLLQRMRDEAHRFAITYYRSLHNKTMRDSTKK